jgi:hypothetical protein
MGLRVTARDIGAVVVLGLIFRVPAAMADFWFDEILSLDAFAANAKSIADIFFASALKHDNNHHLNTLVLYLLGDRSDWTAYRVPSVVCGLFTAGASVLIGQRHGRAAGWITGLLVAASTMFVVYSSEARGYGFLLAASVSAFLALDRYLQSTSRTAAAAFGGSIAAGLAAHPTILHAYLGALLWSAYRFRSNRRAFVRLHAAPASWIFLWSAVVLRGSRVGGGPAWTWEQVLDQMFAWTIGYPIDTVPITIVCLAAVVLILWDAVRLWSAGSDEGLFYVGAIVAPVALLAGLSPPFLFPRYFLVPLLFFLVVAGRSLSRLSSASSNGRLVSATIVALFLAGNCRHIVELVQQRYGTHAAALSLIATSRPDGALYVSSPSLDQWTAMPMAFYSRRIGFNDRLRYIPRVDS